MACQLTWLADRCTALRARGAWQRLRVHPPLTAHAEHTVAACLLQELKHWAALVLKNPGYDKVGDTPAIKDILEEKDASGEVITRVPSGGRQPAGSRCSCFPVGALMAGAGSGKKQSGDGGSVIQLPSPSTPTPLQAGVLQAQPTFVQPPSPQPQTEGQ